MGKKQRRTRWRRLSLGDASGPEEEDDETQQPQPEQPEKPEKPEKPVEEPVEEQERAEGGACTAETDAERRVKQEPRGSSPASSTASVEMPGEQAAHQRPWTGKPGAKQAPSGAYGPPGGARPAPAPGGFRRPRYNNAPPSAGYGRANSWNSYEHAKTHGIEKKIFNDEEYTKISTPRQEVLFKKGSIGAKKRPTAPSAANDSGSEHDSGHASASPTSPGAHLNGDADSFHYSGNDNGSTGDASSTAGDAVGSDGSAIAAGYDAPLVCFPMYDFYGGYPGVYAGGMLVQTYPGGPLVPAVPVPVPVQAVDWYGRGSASASSPGSPPQGELGFYYALGYPTAAVAADVSAPNETGASNSRRNSLESCQASSAEASEGSPSETGSSPTSSGPSSQGPASPQSEPANGSPEKGAQSGASVAAAAATVMDMAMERKMPVAGFLYPYPAYGLAPPLYADPISGALYLDDYGYPYDYEAGYCEPDAAEEPAAVDEAAREPAKEAAVETPVEKKTLPKKKSEKSAETRKKKKKKRKKRSKQAKSSDRAPVTDEGANDEEEEDDEEEAASGSQTTDAQTAASSSPSSSSTSETESSPEPTERASPQPDDAVTPPKQARDVAADDQDGSSTPGESRETPDERPVSMETATRETLVEDTDRAEEVEHVEDVRREEKAELLHEIGETHQEDNEEGEILEQIVEEEEGEEDEGEEEEVRHEENERDSPALIDSPLVTALEKIIAELVDAQGCGDPSPEPESNEEEKVSADEFVRLHLHEKDEQVDEYFEDELVGGDPPPLPSQPPPNSWRTIVLSEEDTFQRKDDVYDLEAGPLDDRSDSGIGKDLPSPAVGPITKAVSLWLETDPQEKLIASTDALESDDSDEEETTGPKNVQGTLRCAASSDDSAQRRVVSPSEEEADVDALTPQCHPAKYSVYYQLGVSVDENDNGDDEKREDAFPVEKRCSSKKKLRSSKRLSWRRSRQPDDERPKRLKPARSCCAVQ